jgi:very-short-patch-repair endonuclease
MKTGCGSRWQAILSGSIRPQSHRLAGWLSTDCARPVRSCHVVRNVPGVRELERRLSAGGGLISREANPDLTGCIDRALRDGRIVSLQPGVYCLAGSEGDPWIRLKGAALWAGPDAVFTGLAAAKLSFWESCRIDQISVGLRRRGPRSRNGVVVEQRSVALQFTRRRLGMTMTSPALTAVDLAASELGGEVIDRVLRMREATIEEMWSAYRAHPYRPGNAVRAQLLHDSRDLPWSQAERLQHRLLRAAGLIGWKANRWVHCGENGYYVDILFRSPRLILEIDGFETHGTRLAFEQDRRRRNDLVLAGYRVLNFTYLQLVDDPGWVIGCIRSALR